MKKKCFCKNCNKKGKKGLAADIMLLLAKD
jgi:hypothetical protein